MMPKSRSRVRITREWIFAHNRISESGASPIPIADQCTESNPALFRRSAQRGEIHVQQNSHEPASRTSRSSTRQPRTGAPASHPRAEDTDSPPVAHLRCGPHRPVRRSSLPSRADRECKVARHDRWILRNAVKFIHFISPRVITLNLKGSGRKSSREFKPLQAQPGCYDLPMTAPLIVFCVCLSLTAGCLPASTQATGTPFTPATEPQSAPDKPASDPNNPCVPDETGNYRIKGAVLPPRLTHSFDPKYSKEARKQKMSGTSVVGVTVNAEGMPIDVYTFRALADSVTPKLQPAAASLDALALDAVKRYRFKPATCEGKAVPVRLRVEVNFKIW
jgi:TonB family protein